MIYIILRAQLGNQLFQILNGICLSLEHEIDYAICIKKNSNTIFGNNITYFDNFLYELNDKINISNEKILENNNNIYNEKNFHYDKIIITKNFEEKLEILKNDTSNYLFIDDLTRGHHTGNVEVKKDAVKKLIYNNIHFVRYNNNWEKIRRML